MKTFKIKDIKGNSRVYKLETSHELQGWCDVPDEKDDLTIYVNPNLKGRAHLETLIHELTHAIFPDWPEEAVDLFAHQQARFLWGHKYRRSQ